MLVDRSVVGQVLLHFLPLAPKHLHKAPFRNVQQGQADKWAGSWGYSRVQELCLTGESWPWGLCWVTEASECPEAGEVRLLQGDQPCKLHTKTLIWPKVKEEEKAPAWVYLIPMGPSSLWGWGATSANILLTAQCLFLRSPGRSDKPNEEQKYHSQKM